MSTPENAECDLHDLVKEPESRLQALSAFYQQRYEETRRYRSLEWQICIWTVGILVAIPELVHRATNTTTKLDLGDWPCLIAALVAILGSLHILYVHGRLTVARRQITKCERILRFFDPCVYSPESVLPCEEKYQTVSYWRGWEHLASWGFVILLATTYALL